MVKKKRIRVLHVKGLDSAVWDEFIVDADELISIQICAADPNGKNRGHVHTSKVQALYSHIIYVRIELLEEDEEQ